MVYNVEFRTSYQHSKTIAASAKTIFAGGVVAPLKTVGNDHALWLASVGEGFGKLQYRYEICLNLVKITYHHFVSFFTEKLKEVFVRRGYALSHPMKLCQATGRRKL